MGLDNVALGLVFAFVQLILGLLLAMGSVFAGLWIFDKLTENVDEMKELKRGNVAVAILLGAIILSIANVVEGGVSSVTSTFTADLSSAQMLGAFVVGLANLVLSLLLAVLTIYISIYVLDKITVGIDEFKELKRGNVAVAIVMAAVLIAMSSIIRGAVISMAAYLSPQTLVYAPGP